MVSVYSNSIIKFLDLYKIKMKNIKIFNQNCLSEKLIVSCEVETDMSSRALFRPSGFPLFTTNFTLEHFCSSSAVYTSQSINHCNTFLKQTDMQRSHACEFSNSSVTMKRFHHSLRNPLFQPFFIHPSSSGVIRSLFVPFYSLIPLFPLNRLQPKGRTCFIY